MAVKFQNGDIVRQVVTPIVGKIVRFTFNPGTGEISYVVSWTDAEGALHERAFSEYEIEANV